MKPIVIRRGSVRVKIYQGTTKADGKAYVRYSLAYNEANGTRQIRNFSDLEEARLAGETIATRLCNGETDVLSLKNADVVELMESRRLVAPFDLTVVSAIREFAAAISLLPQNVSLLEAVKDFAKRHPTNMPRLSLMPMLGVHKLIHQNRRPALCFRILQIYRTLDSLPTPGSRGGR